MNRIALSLLLACIATVLPEAATALDGRWVELPAPGRMDHSAVVDPLRHRLLVFGGFGSGYVRSDLLSFSLDGPPRWESLTPSGDGPPPSTLARLLYDATDDALLVSLGGPAVWRLPLSGPLVWENLPISGTPPGARLAPGVALDHARHRLLMFGGEGDPDSGKVFQLTLGHSPTWSALPTAQAFPSADFQVQAFYDDAPDRVVAVAHDPRGLGELRIHTLSLTGTDPWQLLADPFDPTDSRSLSRSLMAAFNAGSDELVFDTGEWMCCGFTVFSVMRVAHLGPTLTSSSRQGPRRSRYALAYDPIMNRYVAHGGRTMHEGVGLTSVIEQLPLGPAEPWTLVWPPGPEPSEWDLHTTLDDQLRQRVVVFGGDPPDQTLDSGGSHQLYMFTGAPGWADVPLEHFYNGPPRAGHVAVLDAARDRMLVFGGFENFSRFGTSDTWGYDLAGVQGWSMLPADPQPTPRVGALAIMDDQGDRLLEFGGRTRTGVSCASADTVWSLDLAGAPVWSALVPQGSRPPTLCDVIAVYDFYGHRALVLSGTGTNGRMQLWALSLGASLSWSTVTTFGTGPPPGSYSGDIDSQRNRLIVCGGADSTRCWALTLDGDPTWSQLVTEGTPACISDPHSIVYEWQRDRLLLVGGIQSRSVWALPFEPSVVAVPSARAKPFGVRASRNPSSDLAFVVSLPAPARATAEVFDVAGRRLARHELGMLPAGRSERRLPKEDGAACGLRLVRVSAGRESRTLRIMLLR